MDAPVSGDIFPAIQAIRLIDEIDLAPPIEIPPIPPEVDPETVPEEEHRQLHAEILGSSRNVTPIFSPTTTRRRTSKTSPMPSVIRFIWRKEARRPTPIFFSKRPCCS